MKDVPVDVEDPVVTVGIAKVDTEGGTWEMLELRKVARPASLPQPSEVDSVEAVVLPLPKRSF